MIYYTGDIHGDVLHIRDMVTKYEITDQDVIVILGDVGMNYYGNNHGDQNRKKKLNKLQFLYHDVICSDDLKRRLR